MNREPKDAGFVWQQTTEIAGYWSLNPLKNVETVEVEVCLEPTVFGKWLLAVYVDGELAHPEKLELTAVPPGGPLLKVTS